jgi:predicted TIM-barrel fold metal-dependent hydrolase
VDTLVWGSDYPHPESTFPRTRQILARVFADLDEGEVHQMTSDNSCRLYGFAPPAMT